MLAEISIWCYIALIELIIIIIAIMIGNHMQNKLTTYKIYHAEIGQHIETIMLNEKIMYDNIMALKLENLDNEKITQMMEVYDRKIHQNHELLLNIEAKIK